ncbi:MAG: sigma-E processing peptidase SpoIIGA [Firmicutes bacterium]|nr:sigma-E processing peptidase SpoIIGA [Bacillota bacterium]
MYIEDLLALNFMMNTFLLYLTARLMGREVGKRRLFAGGFIAALYSLAIFTPASAIIFSWVGKIAASVIVIFFTFRPQRFAELIRLCGAFFLTSFFLAGTIFAFYFFGSAPAMVKGGIFYLETPRPGMLFAGVIITFSLLLLVWHFSERQRKRKIFQMTLVICEKKRKIKVNALVDTGNQLREPLTDKPLCVASYKALRSLLPEALITAYDQGGDPVEALGSLDVEQETCFGIAPFRSLENSGILVTYRPTLVLLEYGGYKEARKDIVFALTARPLSLDNDVEVLLHPFVLETLGGVVT